MLASDTILADLTGLCKPDPMSGVVEYEPVRDQLIDMYGHEVDHPDFVHLFRFVLAAGGATSVHLSRI